MTVDYADTNMTVSNLNESKTVEMNKTDEVLLVNGTPGVAKIQGKGKTYCDVPLITITSKPSCGCNYGYYWHTKTFVNYCPNCHHYGTLRKNPKGVPERELTCHRCSSDFCGVCGKEKYSWSSVYLRSA